MGGTDHPSLAAASRIIGGVPALFAPGLPRAASVGSRMQGLL